MSKYLSGKIYKLECYETGKIYIGSTIRTLNQRLKSHNNRFISKRYCSAFEVIKGGNFEIKLIEDYPCDSKIELTKREGYYQKTIDCVNYNIAGRTSAEWYQDNKEYVSNRNKMKSTCTCGCTIRYGEMVRHVKTKKHQNILDNPEKYIKCKCGDVLLKRSLVKHKKSKHHQNRMNA